MHHLLATAVYLPLVQSVVACSVQQPFKCLPHVLQWAAASKDFARTLPRRVQSARQDGAALLQEVLALLRDKAVQAGSWVAFAVNHPGAAAGELQVSLSFTGNHFVDSRAAVQPGSMTSPVLLASIACRNHVQGVPPRKMGKVRSADASWHEVTLLRQPGLSAWKHNSPLQPGVASHNQMQPAGPTHRLQACLLAEHTSMRAWLGTPAKPECHLATHSKAMHISFPAVLSARKSQQTGAITA